MARVNKFAGICAECGFVVRAEEGQVERRGEQWIVLHEPSECGSYDSYLDTLHPFSDEALGQS